MMESACVIDSKLEAVVRDMYRCGSFGFEEADVPPRMLGKRGPDVLVVDVDVNEFYGQQNYGRTRDWWAVPADTSFVAPTPMVVRKPLIKPGMRQRLADQPKRVLYQWLAKHLDCPYPSKEKKEQLAQRSGLTPKQVSDFLGNWRKREWKREENTQVVYQSDSEEFVESTSVRKRRHTDDEYCQ